MASVAWGSKLVVRSGDLRIPMRSLRSVDISGSGWAIPVLADVSSLLAAGLPGKPGQKVVVDLTTESGTLQVDVEIVATEGDLMLRPPRRSPSRALRPAALTDQRRENVRGPVRLEFRGATMSEVPVIRMSGTRRPTPGTRAAMGPGDGAQADLVGSTTSISAGGVCVALEEGGTPAVGAAVYGEITLPGGDLVPTLLIVVEQTGEGFRAEFTDISRIDTERLVRLVFHRERGDLARRR
jgi:hypothetical protein